MTALTFVAGAIVSWTGLLMQTSQPAQPSEPPPFVPPPGYVRIEVGSHVVFTDPSDEALVRDALAGMAPPVAPSTAPTDVLTAVTDRRSEIHTLLADRLGQTDSAGFDAWFDETVLPELKKFPAINPEVFYILTTTDQLKAVLRAGWTNPRYYYNRIADEIDFAPGVAMDTDNRAGVTLLPVIVEPDATPEQRAEILRKTITNAESEIQRAVAQRAMFVLQLAIMDYIQTKVFGPIELGEDQKWLGIGVAGVVSAEVIGKLLGVGVEGLVVQMTFEPNNAPVRASGIDLTNLLREEDLRPAYLPHYREA
ncbi:MAG TPA: hypothetical protein PKB10_11075, partial [Tepidisphaeraceae bacterium]|nr:hypothetical protein [Tepidisphaeraceae bacterium]